MTDEIIDGAKEDIGRVEHPMRVLSDEELRESTQQALAEVATLEAAAIDPRRWEISPETAKAVKMISRLSAPGTYPRPFKPDRYQQFSWAAGLDRIADDAAACLGMVLAGRVTGNDFSAFKTVDRLDFNNPELNALKPRVRQAIIDSRIKFVYVGRSDEAAAIARVVNHPKAFIPASAVEIVTSPEIDNTLDQIRFLSEYFQRSGLNRGDIVTMVDFPPRLVRIMRMSEQSQPIPKGIELALFPVATPEAKTSGLPALEIRGAVGYYATTGQAALQSYPYKIGP